MKIVILFMIFLFGPVATFAQSNYAEAMQQGDEAFNNQQYKTAINKYFAAEAFDPSQKNTVKQKLNKVFDAIQAQRKKAEDDKARAQAATEQANKALVEKNAAQAENKIVTDALNEAKKAKEDEHNTLVRTITLLNNIQTIQDSIKREILVLQGVDTVLKQKLIARLMDIQDPRVKATTTISETDRKMIVDYVISNEKKFYSAYTDNSKKYIGIYFPLEEPGAKAKIEALGLSYDDVLAGTQSLTDDQVNILYEPMINSYISYIKKQFGNDFIKRIGPNRLAALTDIACYLGVGSLRQIMKMYTGDWSQVATWLKKSKIPRQNRDADILLTGNIASK